VSNTRIDGGTYVAVKCDQVRCNGSVITWATASEFAGASLESPILLSAPIPEIKWKPRRSIRVERRGRVWWVKCGLCGNERFVKPVKLRHALDVCLRDDRAMDLGRDL
jgi:hypothetical protein